MIAGVAGDLPQNLLGSQGGRPVEVRARLTVVHHHPGNIEGSCAGIGGGLVTAEAGIAPGGQLRQREATVRAAAGGVDAAAIRAIGIHLSERQRGQIARMEQIRV